jgi:hypothetical protein
VSTETGFVVRAVSRALHERCGLMRCRTGLRSATMGAMRVLPVVFSLLACAVLSACGGPDDATTRATTIAPTTTTTTVRSVEDEVRAQLGALHRSTIREVPGLVALFYHHPSGWAVEDTSLDDGETWCRHAWYRWNITEANAADDFTISYTPTTENPDCVPIGEPLVLHVSSRTQRDGLVQLTGDYQSGELHATRTICPGTIDDFEDVCGLRSGLDPPTGQPTG